MKCSILSVPASGINRIISGGLILWVSLLVLRADCQAQEKAFFMANKKKVNIEKFNGQIEKMIDDMGAPGASIAVIDNNKVVFAKGYGYKQASKKEKINDTTVFEACSVSKTYVAYTALKLIDEGKLDLDRPMYLYLENQQLAHDQRYKLITPRMILSHSSGIENWMWDNDPKVLEIVSNPGEKYQYSGAGYTYLANVIETILQKPYEQYIKEMILDSLGLHNTFTTFKDDNTPSNYAIGSTAVGKETEKWKNKEPWPAAGVNVCAGDYAKFLVSIFNRTRLSDSRMTNIVTPIVLISKKNPQVYRGIGFEVEYTPSDTIIIHSGNNVGFKVFIAYSVVNKSGFALFSNYDLGYLMSKWVNELTVKLDLDPYFHADISPQYPSPAFYLLKVYRARGKEAMYGEIEEQRKKGSDKDLCNTLNALSDLLRYEGEDIVTKLLNDNIRVYPKDPTAYYLLGEFYMDQKQYPLAITYFTKSKDLNYNSGLCEEDIAECKKLQKG